MSELIPEQSNELSQEGENRRSLVRRVLRSMRAGEQEEEYEYKSYWSSTEKDWRETEEWEKWREEYYGDPRSGCMALKEKELEEERRRKLKGQFRCDPIPKPDFTYGAVKRKKKPSSSEGEEAVIDLPQKLSRKNIESTVCDLENKGDSATGSEKLLENPLHRLLALEEREQELEKKKVELGKTGCLLENKRSDEKGENPHGEID